jgi:23S rRNA (uracil1939-C5)-methyltransferase
MSRKKKNKVYGRLEISAVSSDGMGIAREGEKVVFVEKAMPGDVVSAQTFQNRKSYEKARIVELLEPSAERQTPFCKHFGVCGGCKWQYIEYAQQVAYKEKIVTDAFERLAKVSPEVRLPIVAADLDKGYRNKMEYTFSTSRWLTNEEIQSGENFDRDALGLHVPGSFSKVVPIETCYLPLDISNIIRNAVGAFAKENKLSYYDIVQKHGFLRNLVVRTTSTGEVLVVVIFFENIERDVELVMEFLKKQFPEITSLNYIINSKMNDSYADLEPVCYSGNPFVIEKLGEFKFKVRPKSFFQTNIFQAEKLYNVARDFAALKPGDVLYDLYSGVGSIGIYLSKNCSKIVGIEQIDQAVEDAKENAQLNQIDNAAFYVGDVRLIMNEDFLQKNGRPDVLVTDPPRAGMHEDVVNALLQAEVPKIVYVSCNPATQARDVALLSEKYKLTKMQAVDMFPHTVHIENVALLELK